MPSEFVQSLYESGCIAERGAMPLIDERLNEVRAALQGLQTQLLLGAGGRPEPHWCDPAGSCTGECKRARALMSRLHVDGAPGEGKDGENSRTV